ncbi:hypothetical protein DCAR_0934044 [Daucus carota subsp. sativus]|uniref:Uncharacterized protein n=1 Tax=Daucus carota subsp. sativus TaxID=79200 RepID=A0A175YE81_DAUCS|nr:PREDICTED: histone-lysine N-methyltransferase, H3 lysine-9 specific SUVH1-like [Daucus carota subsp. sativus]XP_017226972.1 PREDICTED: histone-lysine N-methyltransferase, H3 lysine-9 specific SUVH1-like [Daucus carota subsp. sativus]WOH14525.1 hypothetical protein DCAR_0934044 [Daucus carota subsp. sativus]
MEEGSFRSSIPTYVDKSKVLDVKPLRTLKPLFVSSAQAPPLFSSSPSGPFPSGFTPFYPFSMNGESPGKNQRGGMASDKMDVDGANGNAGSSRKRGAGKQKKAARKSVGSRNAGVSFTVNGGANFIARCTPFNKEDGDREMVEYVLMTFDAVRRRLSQVEEAREAPNGSIKRPDLKAGNVLMSKGVRTNMRKRIGATPGVEIGDIFFFRFEILVVGLHGQSMGGIDTLITKGGKGDDSLAISIVSSGYYDDDTEDKDVLIYSGQGGNPISKEKEASDQKLEKGNLALERSLHQANEVRVIRGMKDPMNSSVKIYVYDGLYTIKESWLEKGKSGCSVFKYKLVRLPGQRSAFADWNSIQKWKAGLSSPAGLISQDISSGAEKITVALVNDVDGREAPSYFTYSTVLRYSRSIRLTNPSVCNCHKACQPGDLNCSCIRNNGGDFPYASSGVLVSQKPLVHECSPTCPCFPTCKNRVSQSGLKLKMEVYKTTDKGWALRSWDPIRAGSFICEYAGEVVDSPSGLQGIGQEDDYIFDTSRVLGQSYKWNYEPSLLNEEIPDESTENDNIPALVISAKNVGNVARFMNHSCNPNVFWQLIQYEQNRDSFLHVAFFAKKHIPPLTELTYDYGISQFETHRRRNCLCGSEKCRGFFG